MSTITYLQDMKGNDIDRRTVSIILLSRREEPSLFYDPTKRLDFPVIVPGENTDLAQLKGMAESTGLNVYARLKGGETCIRAQLVQLMGE